MENQSRNKQQLGRKSPKTKKQANQPRYEDKPWQTPQYGQNENDTRDDSQQRSCGCGS